MSQPQSYVNHQRLDPKFHFVILPILVANLVYRAITVFRQPNPDAFWSAATAFALLLLAHTARSYSLQVQDRVIRLEERGRLAAAASPETLARVEEFTVKQLVALRFASFAELGALAARVLHENLTPKQIKQAIGSWRPDTFRI